MDFNRFYLGDNPSYFGTTFAEEVNCDTSQDSEELLACLQSVSVEDLVTKTGIFEKFFFVPSPWIPLTDKNFTSKPVLPLEPKLAYAQGKFANVNIYKSLSTN